MAENWGTPSFDIGSQIFCPNSKIKILRRGVMQQNYKTHCFSSQSSWYLNLLRKKSKPTHSFTVKYVKLVSYINTNTRAPKKKLLKSYFNLKPRQCCTTQKKLQITCLSQWNSNNHPGVQEMGTYISCKTCMSKSTVNHFSDGKSTKGARCWAAQPFKVLNITDPPFGSVASPHLTGYHWRSHSGASEQQPP